MKKLILILISNILFAQSIPPPQINTVIPPPPENSVLTIYEEEFSESIKPFLATEKYGIGFISYYSSGNEYSTDATFKVFNSSKKKIKYIWFTIAGENPVGDLVKSNGIIYKTLKGVGPVESLEVSTWSFDNVWLTNMVETIKISTIKIQYMDLSFKTLKYNDNMYIGETAYSNMIGALNKIDNFKETESNSISKNFVPDTETIYSDYDQRPEYPGGINAFRTKFSGTFDGSKMKGNEGVVKTNASFVIEIDGSITDIKADGKNADFNSEAVRTIKSINKKWTPAKINGQSVRSLFSLPLTMNFE